MHRMEDTAEDLLRLGAARRAIAAADFAGDNSGPQRVFGAPVRGLNGVGVEKKGEHGGKFHRQMRGEMARDAPSAGVFDQGIELILHVTAGDREAMRGDCAGAVSIAHGQRVSQHVLHPRRKVILPVIAHQHATAAQQMRETGLMDRPIEAAIGRPAIPDERAGEFRSEDGGRLLIAPTGQDRVDRGVRRRERPQPLQAAADLPAGLIGRDHVAVPDLGAQRLVGGTGAISGAVQGVDEPAGGDLQPKPVAKHRADFRQRQPELRMQDRGERDRLRAELRRGRAQRIGGLPGMAPLHATPAGAAAANLDRERAHDRTHDGQIFLILPGGANPAQRSVTVRTRRGQAGVVVFVDVRGDGAMRVAAIRPARPSAGAPRRRSRHATREGGRLAIHLAPRVVELIFEVVDLPAEPVPVVAVAIPVAIGSFVLASQPLDLVLLPLELGDQRLALALLSFELGDQLVARRGVPLRLHASVMPRLSTKYKQKHVAPARRRPLLWSVTR